MSRMMSESQQQRSINNPAKLDRMKRQFIEKTERESKLVSLKTNPLPMLKPSLKRVRDRKCTKCNTGTDLFINFDDGYIEPIDALTMTINSVKGWNDWISVSFLRNIFSKAMSSLVIHPAQIKMLKKLQKIYPQMPLIFVVDYHSSQFDFLLINFVLLINGLKVPTIVSCEAQNYPSPAVAWSVKQLGLMKLTEDVSDHLKERRNIIVSLNGNNFNEVIKFCDSIEAFLVPVSFSSEKIEKNFTLKLFGNENLGILKLNFNEPYTFKDLMKSSALDISIDKEVFMRSHLNFDIVTKAPIMSTSVVAFLILTELRDGTTAAEIACKLDEFCKKHSTLDFAFEGESIDIVEHALEILENLVEFKDSYIKPNVTKIIQLSSYAKALTPLLALKSFLVISALGLKNSEKFVDYNVLILTAADLCDLLQCELPLIKPCDVTSDQLSNVFDQLSLDGILTKPVPELITESQQRAKRMARIFDEYDDDSDDDGYQSRNTNNEVTINVEMIKELNALKDVTMPILEAYLSAAYSLKRFMNKKFSEQNFIDVSTLIMREELEDGNSKYWESCSEAWMRSCLEWLKLTQMVESIGAKLKIHPDFDDSKSIKFLIARIERYFEFS